jgi:hypothetical protein
METAAEEEVAMKSTRMQLLTTAQPFGKFANTKQIVCGLTYLNLAVQGEPQAAGSPGETGLMWGQPWVGRHLQYRTGRWHR